MQLSKMIPEVDTHTHTILSGHAWSTLSENCRAAREKGMKGLADEAHGTHFYFGKDLPVSAMEASTPCSLVPGTRMLSKKRWETIWAWQLFRLIH